MPGAPTGGRPLAEIAEFCGARLRSAGGAGGVARVTGVATLANATASDLSFLSNPRYRDSLKGTSAGAVLVHPDAADDCPVPALVHDQPYLAFARVSRWLNPERRPAPGIDAAAVVAPGATVAASAHVGPAAVVGAGAVLAADAIVGAGCVIGSGVRIGAGSWLVASVTVLDDCEVGARCLLHAGVTIGADGFGLAKRPDGAWEKIPQVGRVLVGDDVEMGANTCVDRGALEDTVIGNGVKLDNLVQVGHGVRIGEHTAIAACTAIAGSATLGKRCTIQGACSIAGHLTIADDVTLTATSAVPASIDSAGVYSSGMPIQPNKRWARNVVRMTQLDDMAKRLRALERAVAESATKQPTDTTSS